MLFKTNYLIMKPSQILCGRWIFHLADIIGHTKYKKSTVQLKFNFMMYRYTLFREKWQFSKYFSKVLNFFGILHISQPPD
jgi:hypothetical protein